MSGYTVQLTWIDQFYGTYTDTEAILPKLYYKINF